MKKKYLVIAGEIKSKFDGDIHFISARKLCDLYRVNPQECVFADSRNPNTLKGVPNNLIVLTPKCDGNYLIESPSASDKGE